MPRPVVAQGPPPQPPPGVQDQQPAGDPPERVGRLARVSGTVSFHTRDDDRWNPATVNYPVTAGDAFWTEPNAQAEIEVSASRIVMAPGTELDIATLNDTSFQASQPQGEIYLRVRAATPDETYAVQTPRGLATFAATGRYGVVAGDTQTPTTVTVIEGSAQISGPGLSMQVGPNQTATISGSDTFQGDVGPAQRDPFLAAMLERERPPPPQAVSPPPAVATMPGGEDLASYGSWSQSPQYGQVWYPQVAPDWVPYRDGRWDYVAPWGWTWVDSQPWGFAPFHYGRWVRSGGRWGWYPGAAPRPVYAPALVTFFGVGAAAGIGIGAALAGGRIGWCPLGPREAYHPWYRASDRYVRQVNIAHANFTTVNRNVTINNFVNRGAATVVPVSALTASRPVRPVVQRVDPAQFAQARPVFGQQPLRPTMATAGVTPAVVRQFNLAATPGAIVQRPTASAWSRDPTRRACSWRGGWFGGQAASAGVDQSRTARGSRRRHHAAVHRPAADRSSRRAAGSAYAGCCRTGAGADIPRASHGDPGSWRAWGSAGGTRAANAGRAEPGRSSTGSASVGRRGAGIGGATCAGAWRGGSAGRSAADGSATRTTKPRRHGAAAGHHSGGGAASLPPDRAAAGGKCGSCTATGGSSGATASAASGPSNATGACRSRCSAAAGNGPRSSDAPGPVATATATAAADARGGTAPATTAPRPATAGSACAATARPGRARASTAASAATTKAEATW